MYSALAVADAAYDAYKLSQLHYITANAGQYTTLHCKLLLFWFPCNQRYVNIWTYVQNKHKRKYRDEIINSK